MKMPRVVSVHANADVATVALDDGTAFAVPTSVYQPAHMCRDAEVQYAVTAVSDVGLGASDVQDADIVYHAHVFCVQATRACLSAGGLSVTLPRSDMTEGASVRIDVTFL